MITKGLTDKVDNGRKLAGMKVYCDEKQHFSKTCCTSSTFYKYFVHFEKLFQFYKVYVEQKTHKRYLMENIFL